MCRKSPRFLFIFFCWLKLICPGETLAQFSLSGTIRDGITQTPLEGALVEIHELNRTASADSAGKFHFRDIRPASYHLHISHVGYSSVTVSQKIQDHTAVTFSLLPTSIELNEIVVESNHFKTGARENSLAMEILDADYLRKKGKGTLVNTMEDLPGINAINTGVGIAKPVIRGMSHNRVIVNNLGIKQEGQQWGSDHGLEIDVFEPGRVEIIKGPGSLRYGSDGLGGVINLFAPALPGDSSLSGSVQGLYKTNNHLIGASAMVQGAGNGKIFRARLSSQDFGDYGVPAESFIYNSYVLPIYGNRLKNTAGKERNFSLMTGIKKNWGYSTLTLSSFHQKAALFAGAVGIPRAYQLTPDGNSRNIDIPYQQTNHLKAVSNTNLLLGKNWVEIDAGYQANLREERSNPHAHGKGPRPEGTLAHGLNLHTASLNLRYFEEKKAVSSVWGLQLEAQKNTRKGFEHLLPGFRKFTAGAYRLDEFSRNNRYTLSGGIRLDYGAIHVDETNEPVYSDEQVISRYYQRNARIRKQFLNFSSGLGLSVYPTPELNAKLNLGTSFRMPTPAELSVNGIHHGTFRHELGNSSLRSERGYQVDVNVSWQKKYLSLVVSGFGSYYDRYIYLAPTTLFSSSLDPEAFPEGGQIYQYRQNDAVYGGGELSVDFHPVRSLHLKSVLECVYNLNLDSRLPLPFTPPPSVLTEISYDFPLRKGFLRNLQLGLNLRNTGKQDRVDRNEKTTPGYYLLGSHAGASIRIGRFEADIQVVAHNLTDHFYINHLSRYKLLNLPEQGRNFSFNLLIPFATM